MSNENINDLMNTVEELENMEKESTESREIKKARHRRTKDEKASDIDNKIDVYLQKISKLKEEKRRILISPAEKRKIENHCKVLAGVTAFELCKNGKQFFTIENFKNRLYAELTEPLQRAFLDKQFKTQENK